MSRANHVIVLALAIAVLAASSVAGAAEPTMPPPSESPRKRTEAALRQIFLTHCSGCHGLDLAGGRAPSLFDERLLNARSDQELHRAIEAGRAEAGMPAFKGVLDDEQLWNLISYLRLSAANMKGAPTFIASPDNQVISSEKQKFQLKVVAAGLEVPTAMAFLPDGRLLVTERPGQLRIVAKGKLLPQPVAQTPAVWTRQDAGMLDVAVHPDYKRNGWIYLAYAEALPGFVAAGTSDPDQPSPNPPSMTVVVRGKLEGNAWVHSQVIFRAPPQFYTTTVVHYGSRLTFDHAGHLFFSIGDRGDMANAQRLSTPLGKIHRVNDDGSVPADNPFVRDKNAVPTLWTYGHRNPQGLAWDPVTGLLWQSEHGPIGGDEINIIERGRNYGWGVITMGIQEGIAKRSEPGMEQPIVHYTPAIAPSGIAFYTGDRYPHWRNNLLVSALAGQQLRRLEIVDRRVVAQEILFQQFGRTRTAAVGPDGLLYVLLQNPTGDAVGTRLSASTPGMVVKLVPLK